MSLGFVHACEQNHLNLSVIGGGGVVQLQAGKVVTCPLDPLFVYNFCFGVRLAYDAAGAEAALRRRLLLHPSRHHGLPVARLHVDLHAGTLHQRRGADAVRVDRMLVHRADLRRPVQRQPFSHAADSILAPMDDFAALAGRIRTWGRELGFQRIGVAGIELREDEARLREWLAEGRHGTMDYMARHGSKRSRPGSYRRNTRTSSCTACCSSS